MKWRGFGARRCLSSRFVRAALLSLIAATAIGLAETQPAFGLTKTKCFDCHTARGISLSELRDGNFGPGLAGSLQIGSLSIPNPIFSFVTRLTKPNGQVVVRRQLAVVDVPSLLDADGDGLPEVIATLQLVSNSKFKLNFSRLLPASVAPLPMLAEAVVPDPTAGLARQNIGFGLDATGSQTPSTWASTVTLGGTATSPALDISTQVTRPGPRIATVGGLFNGDVLSPSDPLTGVVRYAPVPGVATLGLTLGASPEVRAGASVPVAAQGIATLVDGSRARQVRVDIASLPQQIAVRYSEANSTDSETGRAKLTRTVVYSASAPIPSGPHGPSVQVDYTERNAGALGLEALASASNIPTGLTFSEASLKNDKGQFTATGGTFNATGGPLGMIEGGFANGPVTFPAIDHPYLNVADTPGKQSVTGRIDDLQSALVDAPIVVDPADNVTATVQLGPGKREPFDTHVDTADPGGGRTLSLTGSISNIPRLLNLIDSTSTGLITYDAGRETINTADTTIDSNQPLWDGGRVKHIVAHVGGLPPSVKVSLKPANGSGESFGTSSKIDLIEATLTDGATSAQVLPNSETGVTLHDTPDGFAAWVRLKNVAGASALSQTGGQLHAELDTLPLDAKGTRQDVHIDATILDPSTPNAETKPSQIDAYLPALPDRVTIDQNDNTVIPDFQASRGVVTGESETTKAVTYDASSAIAVKDSNGNPVPITLKALRLPGGKTGTSPKDGQPHNVDLSIDQVPTHFQLLLGDASRGVGVINATGSFGKVLASVWDDCTDLPACKDSSGNQLSEPPFLGDTSPNKAIAFTRAKRLAVQARLGSFERFLLTDVLNGTSDEGTRFDVGFGTAPTEVDLDYEFGTNPNDGSDLIGSLRGTSDGAPVPTNSSLLFKALDDNDQAGVHLIWDASSAAYFYVDDIATVGFGAHKNEPHTDYGMTVGLPTHVDICAGNAAACGRASISQTPAQGDDVPENLVLSSHSATGPISFAGNICLPGKAGYVDNHCPGDSYVPTTDFIINDFLQFQDMRLEVGDGNATEGFQSGDELFHLYLDTHHLETQPYSNTTGFVLPSLGEYPNSVWDDAGNPVSGGDPIVVKIPAAITNYPTDVPFDGVSDVGGNGASAANLYQLGSLRDMGGGVSPCFGGIALYKPNPAGFALGDNVTEHVIPTEWCTQIGTG